MVVISIIVQDRTDGKVLFLKHRSILPMAVAQQLAKATYAHFMELHKNNGYVQPRQVGDLKVDLVAGSVCAGNLHRSHNC
jgi:hypothetical protein